MYNLLVKLMIVAAIAELGLVGALKTCHSKACLLEIERAARTVTVIDWKPISVFPEEGKRFH